MANFVFNTLGLTFLILELFSILVKAYRAVKAGKTKGSEILIEIIEALIKIHGMPKEEKIMSLAIIPSQKEITRKGNKCRKSTELPK